MLIQRVADMVRAMHLGGVNHRDCYICHFLLHLPFDDKNEDSLKISVIDLHRAQIRNKVPLRWRNKDLTGLYFSSDNIGLTTRDYYRFLKVYFNRNLKDIIKNEGVFIEQVEGKPEPFAKEQFENIVILTVKYVVNGICISWNDSYYVSSCIFYL